MVLSFFLYYYTSSTKCPTQDFVHFLQCAKFSLGCSHQLSKRLPWKTYSVKVTQKKIYLDIRDQTKRLEVARILEGFPVRIVIYLLYLSGVSDQTCKEAIELFETGKIKTDEIILFKELKRLSPCLFNCLLQVSKIKHISGHVKGDSEYIKQPEFQKIPSLDLTPGESFPIENLLSITSPKIMLTAINFSSQEINRFLKQWYNGSRVINNLVLDYSEEEIEMAEDTELFTGIPFELIWSKDHHPDSVVSKRKIDDMQFIEEECRYYALKREDPSEELLVEVYDNAFSVDSCENAVETFVELSKRKESEY